MSKFQLPNEFETKTLTIDGNDVSGLLVSLSVFENIYTPLVTGHVTLVESDSAKFIEDYKIEAVEFKSWSSKQTGLLQNQRVPQWSEKQS